MFPSRKEMHFPPIKIFLLWLSLIILTFVKVCETNKYCVQTPCQARTAIISGIASVADMIMEEEFEFGLKKIARNTLNSVGFFDKSEPDFCSNFCSTNTTEKEFDQIDEFIRESTLETDELVGKHQKNVDEIVKFEQLNSITKISNRQYAADLLRNEVEDKLRSLDWFAQLDAPIAEVFYYVNYVNVN